MVTRGYVFPCYMFIERREVHCAAWGTIVFASQDHAVAPLNRFAVRDAFYDTECLITKKIIIHFLLPMDRYRVCFVAAIRFCIVIQVNLERRTRHCWNGMVWTFAEGGFAELFE